MSPWIESCYSDRPNLLFGKDIIHSCTGVQQGDPLGPLGFALTLQPIIDSQRFPVSRYLDDGTLVGSPDDLLAALRIVESDGPSIGLHLNRSKSLLHIPPEADASLSPLPPDIPVTRQGFPFWVALSALLHFARNHFTSVSPRSRLPLIVCTTWLMLSWRLHFFAVAWPFQKCPTFCALVHLITSTACHLSSTLLSVIL